MNKMRVMLFWGSVLCLLPLRAADVEQELQGLKAEVDQQVGQLVAEVTAYNHVLAPHSGGAFVDASQPGVDLPNIPDYDSAGLKGTAAQELINHYDRANRAYERAKEQHKQQAEALRRARLTDAQERLKAAKGRQKVIGDLLARSSTSVAIPALPVVLSAANQAALEATVARAKDAEKEAREEFDLRLNAVKEQATKYGNHVREQEAVAARLVNDVATAEAAARAKALVDNEHIAERNAQEHAQRTQIAKLLMVGVPAATIATVLAYYIIRHKFQPRPQIIERNDTSRRSFFERLRGIKPPKSNMNELVLSADMQKRVMVKFAAITQAVMQRLPLSNLMFHGPAGTGKTMAAQALARSLHERGIADHVIIRGGAFKRLGSASKAQKALADILRWGAQSKKPMIYIFDEAETMFADRESEHANEMSRDLTVTMLSFFEKAVDPHKMFVLSSNLPHRIDRALLNRIDPSNRVRFDAPAAAERLKMLDLYLGKHVAQHGYSISDDLRKEFPDLADRMSGLVGRQIESWAVQVLYRAMAEEGKLVKKEQLLDALTQSMEQGVLHAY